MKEVYCLDCKWLSWVKFPGEIPENLTPYCSMPKKIINTALTKKNVPIGIVNSENKCPYFKKEESLIKRIKRFIYE